MDDFELRYPVGKFKFPDAVSLEESAKFVREIEETPARLKAAIAGLSDGQLDTPYRPGGWTVRQVVHHVPDSHLNSYIRFKWALTEDEPTSKAYDEDRCAELWDARTAPVEVSLVLLDSLHRRWVSLLGSPTGEEWKRTFVHPQLGPVSLEKNAALYAWHGRHHVAHVARLREREGW